MLRTKHVAFYLVGIVLLAALASPVLATPRTGADSAISGVLAWLDQLVSFFSASSPADASVVIDPGGKSGAGVAIQTGGVGGVAMEPGGLPSGGPMDEAGGFSDRGGAPQSLEDPPDGEGGVFFDPGG